MRAELAGRQQADVLLFSVVYDDTDDLPGYDSTAARSAIKESMCESEQRRLEELTTHLQGLCKSVEARCEWHECAATAINAAATDFGADVVLLSAGEHARISRIFRENTDWQLIRQGSVPVLACRDDNAMPYARVMAAVTPTSHEKLFVELDERILERARALATECDAKLLVGHVYPSLNDAALLTYMPPVNDKRQWADEHDKALAKLLERHDLPVADGKLVADAPAPGIIRLAREHGVDLLVMGALGESQARRPLARTDRRKGARWRRLRRVLRARLMPAFRMYCPRRIE